MALPEELLNEKRRCVRCNTTFTIREAVEKNGENFVGCAACRSTGVLMVESDDVQIKVNIHELRILVIWAENHAVSVDNKHLDDAHRESMKETVLAICSRLEAQLAAQGKKACLTLTSELKTIAKSPKVGDVQFFRDGKEEPI